MESWINKPQGIESD